MADNQLHPDRWHTRDLPVLLVIASLMDSNPSQAVHDTVLLRELTTRGVMVDREQMMDSLLALSPTYIELPPSSGSHGTRFPSRPSISGLTDAGRRATGLWPNSEDSADGFLEVLRRAEEQTSDPKDKKALRSISKGARSLSGGLLTDLMAAVIVKQSGLG
ncbi:MAG: hypothetical protein WA892_14015 [Ornithinimicrobium sp.]